MRKLCWSMTDRRLMRCKKFYIHNRSTSAESTLNSESSACDERPTGRATHYDSRHPHSPSRRTRRRGLVASTYFFPPPPEKDPQETVNTKRISTLTRPRRRVDSAAWT